MKPYFLDMHTAVKVYLPNLPSLGSLEVSVDNIGAQDDSGDQIPALVGLQHLQLLVQGRTSDEST